MGRVRLRGGPGPPLGVRRSAHAGPAGRRVRRRLPGRLRGGSPAAGGARGTAGSRAHTARAARAPAGRRAREPAMSGHALILLEALPYRADPRVRAQAAALRELGWTVSVACP